MILVDTSIWIDHLRGGNARLVSLLQDQRVLVHPFIIGELAVGNIRQRGTVLAHLGRLPSAAVATNDEVMHLIERRALAGTGLSWVDAHLIASAILTPATLWTLDRTLTISVARLNLPPDK